MKTIIVTNDPSVYNLLNSAPEYVVHYLPDNDADHIDIAAQYAQS